MTERLAEFGKMASMGLGEGLRPADGLSGYFDLLYASRTHGSGGGRGLGAWLRPGLAGCHVCTQPFVAKETLCDVEILGHRPH